MLPFSAGPLHSLGGSITLLWLADGKCLAYTEGSYDGRVFANRKHVESLHLAYDQLRDAALTPHQSRAFIERLLEDCPPCDPADPT
ncbi:Scr1 family TA system antitoxin-like transcriptional regulator [Streptomyces boncukensis]|uniref:Scr1 family TA system antitoxin-like transcriptional regulator n=1 Tax=Streptomyces boncukensis TaxID=2711219 RepID=UPI003B96CE19